MSLWNRREKRLDSLNLLDFVVLGPDDRVVERGLARTLNVSEHGLRIETPVALAAGQEIQITLGLANDMVEIRGRVVHAEGSGELCTAGVEFAATTPAGQATLRRYLDAFQQSQSRH